MTDQPAVEIEGLSFSYDGEPALRDVSLRIAHRDFVCVVGPNGGGKTTLLKLMLGLLAPSAGTVRVLGQPPQRVRHRIGYVPQYSRMDPQFPASAMDVVLTGRLGRFGAIGPFRGRDRAAARQALRLLEAEPLGNRSFAALSGGQRQRVLVARALAAEPELLLLDEPTANLDIAVETELYEYLDRLSRTLTVILVSHDLGFVTEFVRTVVCVNRRVHVHPTQELTGEVIREVYGSDVQMVRHDRSHGTGGHQ